MPDLLLEDLLDGEFDFLHLDLAVTVVDLQVTFGDLLRRVDILGELCVETGCALGAAAPRLDLRSLLDHVVSLKGDRLLSDHENRLVLHVLSLAVKVGLSIVLDLCLGLLFVTALALEEEGRGDVIWQLEVERDVVVAWSDLLRRLPDQLLVAEELLGVLHFLAALNDSRRVAMIFKFGPIANETILAAAFHLERDALGVHNGCHDAHVDGARHHITRLVEGLVHGDLHEALTAHRFFVLEKEHFNCFFI